MNLPCPHTKSLIVALLLSLSFAADRVDATEFVAKYEHWPEKHRINGRVLLGADTESALRVFREIALDKDDDAVVLHLSPRAEMPTALHGFEQLSSEEFLSRAAQLRDSQTSVIIWSKVKEVSENAKARLRKQLQLCLDAGLSICCVESAVGLAGGNDLGLIFDTEVRVLKQNAPETGGTPALLSLEVAPDAVVLLSRRKMLCYGDGNFELAINGSDKAKTIKPRTSRSMPITDWLIDLTQWRRMAMEHSLEAFPAEKPAPPVVENGKLYIVGGGGMPSGLMDQFVEDAGGSEARLVYVPCTEEAEVSPNSSMVRTWKRMGVADAQVLHTKDRIRANTDKDFYQPLKNATGIWFGGGRQWNFADSYYGTETHRQMVEVLNRGGVIGGSSAGASIQARYLARATPIENFDIIAPGYERGGLGFLPGVAIDQHFSQRGRHPDQEQLVATYPQLLGIGIDEATAIVVTGSSAEVTGRGAVYFFDRRNKEATVKTKVEPGEVYDLVSRLRVE